MVTEIEIVEGHNSSDYFWIRPFLFTGTKESFDMTALPDEISIQEDIVSGFLEYFFRKYYDNSLWYNPAVEPDHEYEDDFQWYLTYNFYTYETINKMCDEIQEMADLLEKDDPDEQQKEYIRILRRKREYLIEMAKKVPGCGPDSKFSYALFLMQKYCNCDEARKKTDEAKKLFEKKELIIATIMI